MKCKPIFKERIWGGQGLETAFGKALPPGKKIGESWELADLPQGKTTIANGPFQGRILADIVRDHPEEITGVGDFPKPFPLLIKLLDAREVLSVQVHPDPQTCRRMGRGEPKTECWYIIDAEPGAVIYKGFKEPITRERFVRAVEDGTTADLLAKVPVEPGQCHFLPAGTAHAIGGGLLIAEIQTPSDTTYRVYDWDRLDDAGNPRQLHIEEALESIHFDVTADRLPVATIGRLVDCEHFKVDKGHRIRGAELLLARGQMRTILALSGSGTIESAQADPVDFAAGDCLVVPAAYDGAVTFGADTEYLKVTL
ncbi:type I phosphomannose isomerase catalytic subunit [Anaerobaca lacustris]|uniref:Class I mannose-6-phosphate isomerase n=1 Tax=Anaerobaca lacustris TaxID=3044600 RepID=A0AAW6TUE2_9BACT|nr:class I mannose-6-phosphate isomerase [Sedimentisphaerales bacterium M17dextr]